jgi:Cu(I)/Ag(I) efflux system membrane fusion protein
MSTHDKSHPVVNATSTPPSSATDEGGLHAPPDLGFLGTLWWWFDFLILVKLARLRFIAVLVVIGAVITQWDHLHAMYDKWTRPANDGVAGAESDVEWFCPMHPTIIRDNPREKCPICFMPLSKRKKGKATVAVLPAGVVNRVQLSPYRVVLAGVQTTPVEYQPLTKDITAVGFVEFNERGLRTVPARVKGRLDSLFVNETGQMVEEGDDLAAIYSPELNVSMQNLVDAKKSGKEDMLRIARSRLRLLGVDDQQIEDVLQTGKPNTHLRIRSPIAGHVIRKYVREGDYVDEGMPLYDVADLSTVWILAQVYEEDMMFLPVEQEHRRSLSQLKEPLLVTATTRAFPNEPFHGSLAFVYPHVDQETRTLTVRVEVTNPGHKLRPGTSATVKIHIPPKSLPGATGSSSASAVRVGSSAPPADKPPMPPGSEKKLAEGQLLAVPESSVIDTGSQTIVYREAWPGTYEGVRVDLGPRMLGPNDVVYFPVLGGLEAGERVVTAGSFLVDAETRLNPAAGSIYFGGGSGSRSDGPAPTVRPSTPEDIDTKIVDVLKKLSPDDRRLAESQKFCPILTDSRLGSMGAPVKLMVDGQPVFICCTGCKKPALDKPQETLAAVAKLRKSNLPNPPSPPGKGAGGEGEPRAKPDPKLNAALAKLSPADRRLAADQRACPITGEPLGSMGAPIKVTIESQPVFLCCAGCKSEALKHPQETLKKVEELKRKR